MLGAVQMYKERQPWRVYSVNRQDKGWEGNRDIARGSDLPEAAQQGSGRAGTRAQVS